MILEKNQTLLMYGDSITDCNRPRPDGEGIPAFSPWGTGYVNIVAGMLGACYPELNIRVINKGISGDQVRHLLARFDTDVSPCQPDVISILIGINDVWRCFDSPQRPETHVSAAEYEDGMRRLIEKCKGITEKIVLMTPYIIELNPNDPMRIKMCEFAGICRRLADEYNLIFVDLQEAFDAILQHVHPYTLSWDRIHPGIVGHMVIAKRFLKAIGADLHR